MRKCTSCGYLLLGEGDSCGRCGAALPLVTAPAAANSANAVVPAPAPAPGPPPIRTQFGRLTIPPPGGPPVALGADAPPPPPPPLREMWQPVEMPAPTRSRRRPRWRNVVVATVIAIVTAGAVHQYLDQSALPPGTSAFVSGGGVTYASPDGAFQVQLPKTPELTQRTITEGNVSANLEIALVETDDYEIGAANIALGFAPPPDQVNATLEAALENGVGSTNGKLQHKVLTMRGPRPAIEGTFTAPDGYKAHLLVVSTGSSFIMIIVHSKTGTERLYKALEASLVVR